MIGYKSSVLTCNVDDDDCPICRFVGHDERTPSVLMDVIRLFDVKLFEHEALARELSRQLAKRDVDSVS